MRRRSARYDCGSQPERPVLSGVAASVPICRVQLVRETSLVLRPVIENSDDAAEAIGKHLAHADREHFVVLMLDAKNRLLGIHTAAIGTLTGALVSPREVFKAAILANAASIIVGHNHPSGDPAPSPEDHLVTERLMRAGELLDIPLADHIVLGDNRHFHSLRERGSWSAQPT